MGKLRPAGPAPGPWRRIVALARLGRLRFLAGGVVLYALGTALAVRGRHLDWGACLLGQGAISATQLMTHYANDYFDLEADIANRTPTKWSGGSGVLPRGELSPRAAWWAALVLGACAAILALVVLLRGSSSPGTPLLLVLAIVMSWQYSAPPLRLHSHGMGPATAAVVVAGITPLVGFGMQGAPWSRVSLLAVVPLMISQFALILVLDVPDMAGDAKVNKRTIAVVFGRRTALVIAAALVAGTYASVPFVLRAGLDAHVAWGALSTLPLGALLLWTLFFGRWRDGAEYGSLTWRAVLWFAVLSAAELVGTLL